MTHLAGHLALYSLGLVGSGAIALVAMLGLRRDPTACHRMLVAILYASLLLPLAQFVVEGIAPATNPSSPPLVRRIAQGLVPPASSTSAMPPASAVTSMPQPAPTPQASAPQVRADVPRAKASPPKRGATSKAAKSTASRKDVATPAAPVAPVTPAVTQSWRARILANADRLVWLWLGGAALFLLGQALRLLRTARFLSRCRPVQDPEALDVWRRVAHGSPLRHRIRLLESDQLAAPACWGALTPAIVLPAATFVERRSLAFALLHELVHLERRDPRTRLFQGAFTALYWFHPAAWWLSLHLDRLRELSCDLDVVARVGRRKSYALALLDYAAAPPSNADPLPTALHWSRSHSQLRRRIQMLSQSRTPPSRGRRLMYAGAAGLVLAAAWASQIAIASAFPADAAKLVAFCPPKRTEAPQNVKPCEPCAPCQKPGDAPDKQKAKPQKKTDITRANTFQVPFLAAPLIATDPNSPLTAFRNSNLQFASAAQPAFDDDVREALIRTLLRDDHPSVRRVAAEALAPHVGDARVKEALVAALKEHGDDETRAMLLEALLARESISADVRDVLQQLVGAEAAPAPDPEARRQQLLQVVLDDNDRAAQVSAALGLAGQVDDESVRGAFTRLLMKGSNEAARMIALNALTPWLTQTDEVRSLFLVIVQRDSNAGAKAAAADALVAYVTDANVRQIMTQALLQAEDPVVAQRFVLALAPYASESEVKQAFIGSLAHANDEGVRATVVGALAGAVRPVNPTWPGQVPLRLTIPTETPADPPVVDVNYKQG